MKRLSLVLGLLLVLVMSMSAFAALSTNITGWVDTDLVYKKDDPDDDDQPYYLYARGRARVVLAISAGSSGNPKVTLDMGNAANETSWTDFTSDLGKAGVNILTINGWTLEANGAYWKNGPELKTIVGERNLNWNKYTAWRLGQNSIEVSGLIVGPVNVKGVYGWVHSGSNSSNYNTVANTTFVVLNANGSIDILNFDAYVTNHGVQTDSDNRSTNYTVEASAAPVSGVNLSGVFSYDGENEGTSYKAEVRLTTIPNLTLTGLIRATDEDYNPKHTEARSAHRVWWRDELVYRIAADTTQSGVKLGGSFELHGKYSDDDYSKTVIGGNASTEIQGFTLGATVTLTTENDDDTVTKTVLDASMKLADVTVTYKGTIESEKDMINQIDASTKIDTFLADGVNLKGRVKLVGEEDPEYGVEAQWRLPNGLDMWVGYANFNYSGKDWVNFTAQDGFYVRAYRRISF